MEGRKGAVMFTDIFNALKGLWAATPHGTIFVAALLILIGVVIGSSL